MSGFVKVQKALWIRADLVSFVKIEKAGEKQYNVILGYNECGRVKYIINNYAHYSTAQQKARLLRKDIKAAQNEGKL